jgi:hypothetical protein
MRRPIANVNLSTNGHTSPGPSTSRCNSNGATSSVKSIFRKGSRKSPLAADFLAANEGLNSDSDGAIDIYARAVFRKTHFAESFGDTDYGFEMTDLKLLEKRRRGQEMHIDLQ